MPEGDISDPDSFQFIYLLFTLGWENIPLLLIIGGLLCLSAIISASEVAFFSLSPEEKKYIEQSTDKSDQYIVDLLDRPKKLLATILIANNMVNISIVFLSTYIISFFFEDQNSIVFFLVQVILVTSVILIFGEIIPKVYANRYTLKVAERVSFFIHVLQKIFSPVSEVLVRSTNVFDAFFENKSKNISVNQLSHALELTSDNMADDEDKKILEGIVKFGMIEVRQIMKPRLYITGIDIDLSFQDVMNVILEHGYSRLPVYKDTIDKIEGIINIKDLLPFIDQKDYKWQELIRPAFFVPENKKIDNLLKDFQEKKNHMAIIVDEYGGTSGIVTLEDILEEIVGDISDEYDEEELSFSKLDDQTYVFEGKILLTDLCKVLDVDIEIFQRNSISAETLAGFILELTGRIPIKNERIEYESYVFTIESSDKRRIKQIKVVVAETKE